MRNGANLLVVGAYAAMCAIWGTTWYAIVLALTGFPPLAGAAPIATALSASRTNGAAASAAE